MSETFTKDQAKASDAKLAELQTAVYKAAARVESAVSSLHHAVKDDYRKKYDVKSGWKLTDQEAFDKAREMVKNDEGHTTSDGRWIPSRFGRQAGEAVERYREAKAALDEAQAALRDQDQEWFEHGRWSRFFLVTGVHIHHSTACHTLYPTTQIGWLPELSGETEADAVEAHGALLCTICFPSAPVEWTDGRKKDDDTKCTSQELVPGSLNSRYRTAYGQCADCGAHVTVTSIGRVRKHKKETK